MTRDLFDDDDNADAAPQPATARVPLAPGALLLRGFTLDAAAGLMPAGEQVLLAAPLRHLQVPGGRTMSVAMSNCGALGWVSDPSGYRYSATDPLTGRPWPAMPDCLQALATQAAREAGFDGFSPNACLINSYRPGARMGLHQDRDEGGKSGDFSRPIVSVSLGLPAVFLFGGPERQHKTTRWPLQHGDVVVWGGPARLAFHGVAPLKEGEHAALGAQRVNLTFRQVAAVA
ncbi:MAG: DNA oxidative demethylase AlkB [Polaromonas sp.]|nr:DNA oxidative demethylase AlkB [Polaromonas sp.]